MATLTLKDGFGIIINELRQVSIPADQMLTNGVHVGRAFQIASEIFAAIEKDEQAAAEQAGQDGQDAPVIELVPDGEVPEDMLEANSGKADRQPIPLQILPDDAEPQETN